MDNFFTIYALGDADFMYRVLNAVAMLSNNGDMIHLLKIGLMTGLIFAALRVLLTGGREFPFAHLLVGVIFGMAFFGKTVTVYVQPLTPQPGAIYGNTAMKVDNVPMIAAIPGAILSHIGVVLMEDFEQAFGSPADNAVTTGGFSAKLELMAAPAKIVATCTSVGGGRACDVARHAVQTYLHDCVLPALDMGALQQENIFTDSVVMDGIGVTNGWLQTTTLLPGSGDPGSPLQTEESLPCPQLHARLSTLFSSAGLYSKIVDLPLQAGGYALANAQSATQAISDAFSSYNSQIGSDIGNYYAGMMVASNWRAAAGSGPMAFGQSVAFATATETAAEQRSLQAMGEENLYLRIMRPMIGFFESLIYALAPFMAFLIGLGAIGIGFIGRYAMITLWVQLWFPILAVINLYEDTQLQHAINLIQSIPAGGTGSQATTMSAMLSTHDQIVNLMTTCSMLAASTPAIALAVIYGSAVTATFLAGRLSGGDHINEKVPAPDMMKEKAFSQFAPMHSGDETHGSILSGASTVMPNIKIGSSVAHERSSAEQASVQRQEAFMENYGKLFENSSSWGSGTQAGFNSSIQATNQTTREKAASLLRESGISVHNDQDLAMAVGAASTTSEQFRATIGASFAGSGVGVSSGSGDGTSDEQKWTKRDGMAEQVRTAASKNSSLRSALANLAQEQVTQAQSSNTAFGGMVKQSTNLTKSAQEAASASKLYSDLSRMSDSGGVDQNMGMDGLSHRVLARWGDRSTENLSTFRAMVESDGRGLAYQKTLSALDKDGGIDDPVQRQIAAGLLTMAGQGAGATLLPQSDQSEFARRSGYKDLLMEYTDLGAAASGAQSANPLAFKGQADGLGAVGSSESRVRSAHPGSSETDAHMRQQVSAQAQTSAHNAAASHEALQSDHAPEIDAQHLQDRGIEEHSADAKKRQLLHGRVERETDVARAGLNTGTFGMGPDLPQPEAPKNLPTGKFPDGK